MPEIQFWYSIGSTYTYLSVMRLAEIAAREGVNFVWRPFSVRAIMREMDNLPIKQPLKIDYMWRDLARRAQRHGLPAKLPAPYPLENFDLANQIAVLGAQEGWCAAYTKATYACWFHDGNPAGTEANLKASLNEIGEDFERVLADAQSQSVLDAFARATDEARELRIFGAPTFLVEGEMFWGDDRLEDAVEWALAVEAV